MLINISTCFVLTNLTFGSWQNYGIFDAYWISNFYTQSRIQLVAYFSKLVFIKSQDFQDCSKSFVQRHELSHLLQLVKKKCKFQSKNQFIQYSTSFPCHSSFKSFVRIQKDIQRMPVHKWNQTSKFNIRLTVVCTISTWIIKVTLSIRISVLITRFKFFIQVLQEYKSKSTSKFLLSYCILMEVFVAFLSTSLLSLQTRPSCPKHSFAIPPSLHHCSCSWNKTKKIG